MATERMAKSDVKSLSGNGCHDCAPKEWRGVPKITGDYDLDATIVHRKNGDLPRRLALYTRQVGQGQTHRAYHGYSGNHGDD